MLRRIVVGLLLGLSGSVGAGDLDALDVPPGLSESPQHSERMAEPERRGHLRRGPGFTVWEETPEEADAWATELATARGSTGQEPAGTD